MKLSRSVVVAAAILGIAAALGRSTAGQGVSQPQTSRDVRQQPPAVGGIIAGTLVTADSGRAVRRARVSLSSPDQRVARSVSTDDQGRFSFGDLPAGQYTLSASRPGWLDVTYGQKRPGSGRPGTPIQLATAQKLDSITLAIPRGGILTGVVTDEQGEPAFGVQVRALRYVMRSGERTLVGAGSASTDDRGIYRITSLLPGEYVVVAAARLDPEAAVAEELKARLVSITSFARARGDEMVVGDMVVKGPPPGPETTGPATGYAPVYYPGTVQMSAATSITLDVSEERASVDLPMQLVPMARISGVLIGDGTVPAGAEVRLIDNSVSIPGMSVRTTRTTPKGEFSFGDVPPGNYTLLARATVRDPAGEVKVAGFVDMPDAGKRIEVEWTAASGGGRGGAYFASASGASQTRWAMADVSVAGQDLANLGLTLQSGMTVSGSVSLETPPTNPADITRIRVSLMPLGQTMSAVEMAPVSVDANGRFTVRGVTPGKYRVSATGAPGGLALGSAIFAGNDALDTLLEVKPGDDVTGGVLKFSSTTTELSGAIQDSSGQPTSDYTIIVFTAEDRFWTPQSRRIQATRTATDGRFVFRGLPPGDYRLIAITDVEPGRWYDPAFLRELVGASMPLKLAEGERRVQDVRVGR